MKKITFNSLEAFCKESLIREGMCPRDAQITAQVLTQADAFGISSHGTKNLYGYIRKARAKGVSFTAQPVIERDGPAFALIHANNCMGMVSSCMAMDLAIQKARTHGIAITTVKEGSHFGAAGYYANMAARRGLLGVAMSNVDPNMTVPGAKGMILGNNPISYASPLEQNRSCFLDIALSNVASLKVIQAKKEGKSIPDTWIVDHDGLPTTDPSHYPAQGAMQPMASHKGYGLAVFVELLTGVLSGGAISSLGEIPSWCFSLEAPNRVSHTFLAIDVEQFSPQYLKRSEQFMEALHTADKAKGTQRIYVPGEMEWERYETSSKALELPDMVAESLCELSADNGVDICWAM